MEFLAHRGPILVRWCVPGQISLASGRTWRQFEQPQAAGSHRRRRCRRMVFPGEFRSQRLEQIPALDPHQLPFIFLVAYTQDRAPVLFRLDRPLLPDASYCAGHIAARDVHLAVDLENPGGARSRRRQQLKLHLGHVAYERPIRFGSSDEFAMLATGRRRSFQAGRHGIVRRPKRCRLRRRVRQREFRASAGYASSTPLIDHEGAARVRVGNLRAMSQRCHRAASLRRVPMF